MMPFEEAIDMLKKSIKKMYGKKGQASVMLKNVCCTATLGTFSWPILGMIVMLK